MTGANLDGASLVGADLRGVWMQCASLDELLLTEDRRAARCASARAANFYKARLGEAQDGRHRPARRRAWRRRSWTARSCRTALMIGTDFASAQLERANLSGGALLQGANFLLASLQGADLSGAKLQMADLANAGLQGANLALASLEGAVLRDAEMDGANLQMSRLHGADLKGAKMQGADLSGAVVWRAPAAGRGGSALSDMAQIVLQPPSEEDWRRCRRSSTRLEASPLKTRMSERPGRLLDRAQNARWASSARQQLWQGSPGQRDGDGRGLPGPADRLPVAADVPLAFANGRWRPAWHAAPWRRASRATCPPSTTAEGADCPASATMRPRMMRDLARPRMPARGQ